MSPFFSKPNPLLNPQPKNEDERRQLWTLYIEKVQTIELQAKLSKQLHEHRMMSNVGYVAYLRLWKLHKTEWLVKGDMDAFKSDLSLVDHAVRPELKLTKHSFFNSVRFTTLKIADRLRDASAEIFGLGRKLFSFLLSPLVLQPQKS